MLSLKTLARQTEIVYILSALKNITQQNKRNYLQNSSRNKRI